MLALAPAPTLTTLDPASLESVCNRGGVEPDVALIGALGPGVETAAALADRGGHLTWYSAAGAARLPAIARIADAPAPSTSPRSVAICDDDGELRVLVNADGDADGERGLVEEARRFRAIAAEVLVGSRHHAWSTARYLSAHDYSPSFQRTYVGALGTAALTAAPGAIALHPIAALVADWIGRGLHPGPFAAPLVGRSPAGLAGEAQQVTRGDGTVVVHSRDVTGQTRESVHDAVIFAVPAPQLLGLLTCPSLDEVAVFRALRTRHVRVIAHGDSALMPREHAAWSSCNCLVPAKGPITVTWWPYANDPAAPRRLFVSIDPAQAPDPASIVADLSTARTIADARAREIFARLPRLQGRGAAWFLGPFAAPPFARWGQPAPAVGLMRFKARRIA